LDTIKLPNGQHASLVDIDEQINCNDIVRLVVTEQRRKNICRNHSATHLLNEALREVVGKHVVQQGSNVTDKILRFDFNNFIPINNEQILAIENIVNKHIFLGHIVDISEMPIEKAKTLNVQALFGEKYKDIVRVVDMKYSKELCGGTHVKNTSDINSFAILNVETKGSGIYRIEATTGENILPEFNIRLANIIREIESTKEKIEILLADAKEKSILLDKPKISISDLAPSYSSVINKRRELENLKDTNMK
jgi:alanyl-tRNA synthetase